MKLECTVVGDDRRLPLGYGKKEGENVSPPLAWSELPEGTRELALVFEDVTSEGPDPSVSWLLYKLPPDRGLLPEGLPHTPRLDDPPQALQGRNSLGHVGYDGPVVSEGKTSKYRFRLLALDQPLNVEPELDRQALESAASGHVLDEATLVVDWERPREF